MISSGWDKKTEKICVAYYAKEMYNRSILSAVYRNEEENGL